MIIKNELEIIENKNKKEAMLIVKVKNKENLNINDAITYTFNFKNGVIFSELDGKIVLDIDFSERREAFEIIKNTNKIFLFIFYNNIFQGKTIILNKN